MALQSSANRITKLYEITNLVSSKGPKYFVFSEIDDKCSRINYGGLGTFIFGESKNKNETLLRSQLVKIQKAGVLFFRC